jgi:hypothetical protein
LLCSEVEQPQTADQPLQRNLREWENRNPAETIPLGTWKTARTCWDHKSQRSACPSGSSNIDKTNLNVPDSKECMMSAGVAGTIELAIPKSTPWKALRIQWDPSTYFNRESAIFSRNFLRATASGLLKPPGGWNYFQSSRLEEVKLGVKHP